MCYFASFLTFSWMLWQQKCVSFTYQKIFFGCRYTSNVLSKGSRISRISGIPGVKKKWNGRFSVPCDLKILYFLTSLNKASCAEENDTKIIEFGWANFDSMPISWKTVIFKFCLIFATNEHRFCKEWLSYARFRLRWHRSMGFLKNTIWKAFPDTILRSSVAKINQIQWSWYHSLLWKMFYLMM